MQISNVIKKNEKKSEKKLKQNLKMGKGEINKKREKNKKKHEKNIIKNGEKREKLKKNGEKIKMLKKKYSNSNYLSENVIVGWASFVRLFWRKISDRRGSSFFPFRNSIIKSGSSFSNNNKSMSF